MKKIFTILLLLVTVSAFAQTAQWTFVSYLPAPNPPVNSITVPNANTVWVVCDASGGAARVYKSTNGGVNWLLRNGGLPAVNGYGIFAFDTTTAIVGNTNGSLYKTTNGGFNWTNVLTVTNSFSNGVHMFNANYGIYSGDPTGNGAPYQFRITTDGGNTWNLAPTAPIASNEFGVINAWDWTDSSHIWIGSANTIASAPNAKVYRTSTGYYGTWSNAVVTGTGGSTGCYYQAVGFINATSGMVGSSGGDLRKTTDGGVTFTNVTTTPWTAGSVAVINMNALKDGSNTIRVSVAGDTTRMFKTTNLGTTWVREPLPAEATVGQIQHVQFLSANVGFAGLGATGGIGGFIKYSIPTGITPINSNIPAEFSLSQNYPNPFNPSTMIKFSLPKSGNVTLKVYNTIGKEVETLINEDMSAGTYEVTFDASKLNSGMYFYRLNTNGFSETKRMMLVK